MQDKTVGRAAFLGLVGAGVAGLFFGRDALGLLGKVVPNSVESIVPTAGWRIYTIGSSIPRLDPKAYRLTIGGAVDRPVTYTLDDLRSLPRAEQVSDFKCVTGWRVDDVRWGGVRFHDLLAEAGVQPSAKTLRFVSAEVPYDDTLTLPQAFGGDVLLALDMDGQPLSEGARLPRAGRDAADVRLQEREVGHADRGADDVQRPRFLGAARVRQGRVDRRVERVLSCADDPRASAAPSARSTGCTRRGSSRCSRRASCSTSRPSRSSSRAGTSSRTSTSSRRSRGLLRSSLVIVLGDRRRLAEDWREIETLDRDDRRWLRGRPAAQGRFNAGQKVNAILTAAFAVLFAISGFFLWLGERDHRFLFDGTGTVHDTLTLISVGLVVRPPLPRG